MLKLDMNGYYIEYDSTAEEHNVYSLFVNNGGYFNVNNLNRFDDGSLVGGIISLDSYDTGTPENPSADYVSNKENYLIENVNGGYLALHHDVVFMSYMGGYCIKNTNGNLLIDSATVHSHDMSIYNGKSSHYNQVFTGNVRKLSIIDGIDNYGTMSIQGGTVVAPAYVNVAIRNYGLITSISGGEIKAVPIAIINKEGGTIGNISGGVFGYEDAYIDPLMTSDFGIIKFEKNSTIHSITGGEFYAHYELFSDNVPKGFIKGGIYFGNLPNELLAEGYKATYSESTNLYSVSEK